MTSANERAFSGYDDSASRWLASQPGWWHDHYASAAGQIIDEFSQSGVETAGRDVLDIGCGDGMISLGMLRQGKLGSLTGMDIVQTDVDFLNLTATQNGDPSISATEPIRFVQSPPDTAPFADETFDLATAWSVFEHVTEPRPLLRDVHRVLRPGGVLFIQVWPLWYSEHGSHLWPLMDDRYLHLTLTPDQMRDELGRHVDDPVLAQSFFDLYESCNRTTVDEIQAALLDTGFGIGKVTLTGASVHVPPEVEHIPLSQLAIDGCIILAVRR